MAKKPGTMLRECTEVKLVHLRNLGAEVEIFDGTLPENKYSQIHYMVTIIWYAGILIVEASKDNQLSIAATESSDKGPFFNSFKVTGYSVMRDTIKAVWDSIEYGVYTADVSMETIYNRIVEAAKQSLYS